MIRFGSLITVIAIAGCVGKDATNDGGGGTDGGDTDGSDDQCEVVEFQRTYLAHGFASVWGDGQTVWATGYGIAVAGTAGAIADVSPVEFAYGDRVTGAEGHVFTAGWGELMELADGEWIRHEGPEVLVEGLWAAAADQVWLVSRIPVECEECSEPSSPYAVRWDGTEWIEDTPPASAGLRDVWGVGADDLHVVGEDGVSFRRLDGEWVELATDTTSTLVRVHGNRADNVWALGIDKAVLRFDGATWSAAPSVPSDHVLSLWVGADDTVYVLGGFVDPHEVVVMRLDADVWTLATSLEGDWVDLWGDEDALWVVGDRDDAVVRRIPLADPSQTTEEFHAQNLKGLESLHAIDADHAVAVSASRYFDEWRDGRWSGRPLGPDLVVKAVWAVGIDDVFVTAARGEVWDQVGTTVRVQGDEITELPVPDADDLSLRTVWGRSASDVWTGGDDRPFCEGVPECPPGGPRLLHFDGAAWTDVEAPPSPVEHLHGDADRLVAVTWDGLFVQDSGAWTQISTPGNVVGHAMVTEDGTIWVIVDGSLHRVADGAAVPEPDAPTGVAYSLAAASGGLVLTGNATPDGVPMGFAARLEGSAWTMLLTTPGELLRAAAWADDTLFLASSNVALRLSCPAGP